MRAAEAAQSSETVRGREAENTVLNVSSETKSLTIRLVMARMNAVRELAYGLSGLVRVSAHLEGVGRA